MIKAAIFKYGLPILAMFILNFIYFWPAFTGKYVQQDDIINGIGMQQETFEHREKTGEVALWTNSMFSGMPSFQTGAAYPNNVLMYIKDGLAFVLGQRSYFHVMALLMLGFFVLLTFYKVDPWLAFAGSVAFAFSAFFLISFAAGHTNKIRVAAYIAPMLAGVVYAYRGKLWLGMSVTAIAAGLSIQSNHIQVTYYGTLFIGLFVLVELIYAIMDKKLAQWLKATGLLAVAGIIAVLPNISALWSNYDYQKETMRGGISELSSNQEFKGGLDFDYAMMWSYGKLETLNLIYPDIMGGGMTQNYEGTQTHDKYFNMLKSNFIQSGMPRKQAESQANKTIASFFYWGDQSLVNGGFYIGALVFFLFVLAFFLLDTKYRIWIGLSVILSIFMAWGKNLEGFNRFLFDYLPLYKKFRVPSMGLTILFVAAPFAAFLAASAVYKKEKSVAELKKALLYTLYITGGISAFLLLFGGGLLSFEGLRDANLKEQGLDINALMDDRASLMRASAFRVLLVCGAAFGLFWLYLNQILKPTYLTLGIILIIAVDQFSFLRQHLTSDDYVTEKEYFSIFQPTTADLQILQDPDPHFRVYNTTRSLTSDAITAYNHKSIGGYHGAKLGRYQDLIDRQLSRGNQEVVNMLNTKYFIFDNNGQLMPQRNPNAAGNAWIPENRIVVAGADAEMEALDSIQVKRDVAIDVVYDDYISDVNFGSSNSVVSLTEYTPNRLTYTAEIDQGNRLVVFSEIFYEGRGKDWRVFIDGEETTHIRVNYLLRGLKVPQGSQEIVFSYEPVSYIVGEKLAMGGSIIFILFVGMGLFFGCRGLNLQAETDDV